MNDKQNNLTHKKVKTKMSVDIMHKMREIVNLPKLMRHFWFYEPFNTWSLGIQSPLSIPRCLDVQWEIRLLACSAEAFFPPRPPFHVFDILSRLPHYLRAWNRLPSCDEKRDFAGYNTCCWNIFGKRVICSLTVGIISPVNWQSSHHMKLGKLLECTSMSSAVRGFLS